MLTTANQDDHPHVHPNETGHLHLPNLVKAPTPTQPPNNPPHTPGIPLVNIQTFQRLTFPPKHNPSWPTTLKCKLPPIPTPSPKPSPNPNPKSDPEAPFCDKSFTSPTSFSHHIINDHGLQDTTRHGLAKASKARMTCRWPGCRYHGTQHKIQARSMYAHTLWHAVRLECPFPECDIGFRINTGMELKDHIRDHARRAKEVGEERWMLPYDVDEELVKYSHFVW